MGYYKERGYDQALDEIERAKREEAVKLSLQGLWLTRLPPEIGQLTNLIDLDLSRNQLTAPPSEIGKLINLTTLNLSSNNLTMLPPHIGYLTHLTSLDLNANELISLPSEIGTLTKLRKLDLTSNQLTTLPPEMGQLTNLTNLGLAGNKLTTLPPEFGQLTNLHSLSLEGNQLLDPPQFIADNGIVAIRLYFEAQGRVSKHSQQPNKPKVFISYVHENKRKIAFLRRDLESARIEVWQDINKIWPGDRWKAEIKQAIQHGAFFLACFSQEYWKRDETYMNEELRIAIDQLRKKPKNRAWFIPVLVNQCKVPDWDIGGNENLTDLQRVPLFKNRKTNVQKTIETILGKKKK